MLGLYGGVGDGNCQKERTQGSAYERPDDLIQGMMDLANEKESNPEAIIARYIFTIIGSMHVVREALIDSLYEVCARPEYLAPLRTEMEQVLTESGGWKKGTALKMRKLDSFMKEVMRHHPPTPLSLRRVVIEPITLSDGLHLPKDTIISVIAASQFQEEVAAPGDFDGFRYHKKSLEKDSGRYQYSSSDDDHMSFGIGRYACPGRFVASAEIKMIMTTILLKYDLKFLEGKERPHGIKILDFDVNDPAGRVMARQRVG